MKKISVSPIQLTVLIATLAGFFIWFLLLHHKFRHFGYMDWDLAIYTNIMANLSEGRMDSSMMRMNFLANHTEYIAFLLVPIFKIFPHAMTLVAIKLAAFFVSAWYVFRIAERNLTGLQALIVYGVYVVYLPNITMIGYEFHFGSLSVAPMAAGLFYYLQKRYRLFLVCMILLIMIKENMPLIVTMFGIHGFFHHKDQRVKWGVVPFILGAAAFAFAMLVVIPWGRQVSGFEGLSGYLSLYTVEDAAGLSWTATLTELTGRFWHSSTVTYLCELFLGLLSLPLWSPGMLFLGLPFFGQHLLSESAQMHTIYYHYTANLSPIIFTAFIMTLAKIHRKWNYPVIVYAFLVGACILTVGRMWLFLPTLKPTLFPQSRTQQAREALLEKIPPEVPVMVTMSEDDHLAVRPNIISVQDVFLTWRLYNRSFAKAFKDVEYALVNFSDPWFVMEFQMKEKAYAGNMRKVFSDGTWFVEEMVDDIVLFKHQPGEPLIEVSSGAELIEPDAPLTLKASHAGPVERRTYGFVLPMEFIWQGAQEDLPKYYVKFLVRHKRNVVYVKQRPIGYHYYPTNVWQAGDEVKERYGFLLTGLIPGDYEYGIVVLPKENLGAALDFSGADGSGRVWAKGTFTIQAERK